MNKVEAMKQIKQEYPELIIEDLRYLGNGFDSEAFLLNDAYVFKFPRHTRAAKNLYKEALVLREKIEGVPLDAEILATLTDDRKEEMAKELAAFFKALHRIEWRTQVNDLEVNKNSKAAYEYEVIKEAAYPLLNESVKQEIDEVYDKLLKQEFHYTKCLIHNDFGASNVYYDRVSDKICGLIDFGDIALYDRDMEFVCLMYDYEEGFDQEFVRRILDYYGMDSKDIENKLAFTEFYNQLENVYLGKEFGMADLFEDSVAEIKAGLKGFKENILLEDKTMYYL